MEDINDPSRNYTFYWSNSARGFFVKEIHGDNKPVDCTEITYEEWIDYLDKQNKGFELMPGTGMGKPTPVDRNPTPTQLEEVGVRNNRNALLFKYVDSVNQVRWSLLTPEQQSYLQEYRQKLLDVPQQAGFPFDVIWPTEPDFKV
jgi:hypothetical protein